MDREKQFEVMAAIRAYARKIVNTPEHDVRPSVAQCDYAEPIARMAKLVKDLETRS